MKILAHVRAGLVVVDRVEEVAHIDVADVHVVRRTLGIGEELGAAVRIANQRVQALRAHVHARYRRFQTKAHVVGRSPGTIRICVSRLVHHRTVDIVVESAGHELENARAGRAGRETVAVEVDGADSARAHGEVDHVGRHGSVHVALALQHGKGTRHGRIPRRVEPLPMETGHAEVFRNRVDRIVVMVGRDVVGLVVIDLDIDPHADVVACRRAQCLGRRSRQVDDRVDDVGGQVVLAERIDPVGDRGLRPTRRAGRIEKAGLQHDVGAHRIDASRTFRGIGPLEGLGIGNGLRVPVEGRPVEHDGTPHRHRNHGLVEGDQEARFRSDAEIVRIAHTGPEVMLDAGRIIDVGKVVGGRDVGDSQGEHRVVVVHANTGSANHMLRLHVDSGAQEVPKRVDPEIDLLARPVLRRAARCGESRVHQGHPDCAGGGLGDEGDDVRAVLGTVGPVGRRGVDVVAQRIDAVDQNGAGHVGPRLVGDGDVPHQIVVRRKGRGAVDRAGRHVEG